MMRGALLGIVIGGPFGVGIAWLAGMLDGWNWPFVVFQSALVFGLTLGWTAPLCTDEILSEQEHEYESTDTAETPDREAA